MKRKLLMLCGGLLFIYGVILCIVTNLNFGSIFTLGLGGLLFGIGLWYEKFRLYTQKGFPKFFKICFFAGVCVVLILSLFLAIYGVSDSCTYQEDAVIVLGTSVHGTEISKTLKYRLDKAVEYHKKNPEALIVVSGGQGVQEDVTEAYAMEQYLIQNGVNPDKIIKEEKSTSTSENIKFSKEILDTYFEGDYSVTVITNAFHVYRGAQFAQSADFEKVTTMHADMEWYSVVPCYLRECVAVVKMWVFRF